MLNEKDLKNITKITIIFLAVVSAYFLVKFFSEVKFFGESGEKIENTITSPWPEIVIASPDIANIYFTIESSKSTQGASSDEVNTKTKQVIDFLQTSNVAEKDIKTEGYNSYPKYSNPAPCPVPMMYGEGYEVKPCVSESKIIGYTVSQSVSVKIRKVDDTSKIIDGINKIGVTNMSGPDLSIDDQDGIKADARALAITDAKVKAKRLAKDLGVHLGRIVSFSESGNYPIMYGKATMMSADSAGESSPSVIPTGENKITSDVTIGYEI